MFLLSKMEWTSKVINHIVVVSLAKPDALEKLKLRSTVRIGVILAEQQDANLTELAKLLEDSYAKLQQAEVSKLTPADISLTYYLLFSKFPRHRMAKIE